MTDMKTLIISIFIGLLILVGFGATFITMATDEEHGYDVPLSPAFKETYFNTTESELLVGDITTVNYNMTDELTQAKAKSFDDYFDITQQMARLVSFPFIAFSFVKDFFIAVSLYIGIPPVVLSIALGLVLLIIIVIGAKILKIEL